MKEKSNWLIISLLTPIFLLSNLHSIGVFKNRNITVSIVLLIILIVFVLCFTKRIIIPQTKHRIAILIWLLFGFSVLNSMRLFNEFNLLNLFLLFIAIPLLFLIKELKDFKKEIYLSIILGSLPMLYFIGFGNSKGIIYALLGISIFTLLLSNKTSMLKILITMGICTLFIIATESRTSLLAFLIAIMVQVIIIYIDFKTLNFKKFLQGATIFSIIIMLILLLKDYFWSFLFNKYQFSQQDLFSSRTNFWEVTLDNGVKLFGNGSKYFINTFNIGDSHNTFIEVLGIYGSISLILFVIIVLHFLIMLLRVENKFYYLPFIVLFLAMSMAENLFFINNRLVIYNFLFIVLYSMLINEKKISFRRWVRGSLK